MIPVKGSSSQPRKVLYKLNARDYSHIYGVSAVRVFVLLFSFSAGH